MPEGSKYRKICSRIRVPTGMFKFFYYIDFLLGSYWFGSFFLIYKKKETNINFSTFSIEIVFLDVNNSVGILAAWSKVGIQDLNSLHIVSYFQPSLYPCYNFLSLYFHNLCGALDEQLVSFWILLPNCLHSMCSGFLRQYYLFLCFSFKNLDNVFLSVTVF